MKHVHIAIGLILLLPLAMPANRQALRQRFLSRVWKNISHINSDTAAFGSDGERVTAGVRGKSFSLKPIKNPTKESIRKRITYIGTMLFRDTLTKAQRTEALFYIGACHLFLGEVNKAELYYDRLFRYAPDSPQTAQLRRDIAMAGGR